MTKPPIAAYRRRRDFRRGPEEQSAQLALDERQDLQDAIRAVWKRGPAEIGLAVASMLDHVGVSAAALDGFLLWAKWDELPPYTWPADDERVLGPPLRKPVRRSHLRLVPLPEDPDE